MYCPSCEFEIKQDVTECPICGRELVENSPETTDTASESIEEAVSEADAQRDAHISEVLLKAKNVMDDLDHIPPAEPRHSAQDIFGSQTNTTKGAEEVFLLDDTPLIDEAPAQSPDWDSPATLPDEALFIDETGEQQPGYEASSFIDEVHERKLASSLDAMTMPSQQHASDPFRPGEQDGSVFDSKEFISNNSVPHAEQPGTISQNDLGSPGFDLAEEVSIQAEGTRPKSRFMLPLLLLLIIIGGAYAAWTYLLSDSEPSGRLTATAPQRIDIPAPQKPKQQDEASQTVPTALTEQLPQTPETDEMLPVPAPEEAVAAAPEQAAADIARADETADRLKPEITETAHTDAAAVPPEAATPLTPAKAPAAVAVREPQKTEPEIAPAPAKTPQPAQPFSLHVASFKTRRFAENEIKRLRLLDFDAYLETVDLGTKGIWHRVKIGHYTTRDEARQALQDYIRKHPGAEALILKNP